MILNENGKIADKFWRQIPDRFDNVRLDEHCVMPNHIHGIIEIIDEYYCRDARSRVSTSIPMCDTEFKNKFGPLKKKSLSSIIHAYKSSVKRWCNKNGYKHFAWQERFYDHIIRNEKSLENIRQYIIDNVNNWEEDRNNPKNEGVESFSTLSP